MEKSIKILITASFIAIGFFAFAEKSSAATYYVDNVSGDDLANDGSEPSPWSSIRKAMYEVSAGDTVNIINNGPQNPYREEASVSPNVSGTADNKIIIQGPSQSQYAYIVRSINLTEGENFHRGMLLNQDMEFWTDSSTQANWGMTGSDYTVTKESAEVYSGDYSMKLELGTAAGNEANVSQYHYLRGATDKTFTFYYKSNQNMTFRLRDSSANEYWKGSGTGWASGGYGFSVPASANWTQFSIDFTLNGDSLYYFWIQAPFDNTVNYLDEFRLTDETNVWEVHVGGSSDTYKIYLYHEPRTMFGSLASEWNLTGVNSVSRLTESDGNYNSLGKGQWDWDSYYVYYRLNDGETINTVHIETNDEGYAVQGSNKDHIIYRYLDTAFGYKGFENNGSSSGRYEYCSAHHNADTGFVFSSSSVSVCQNCESSYNGHEDGFHATGGATATCNNCEAHENWDDGFQVSGGTLNINNGLAWGNGLEGLNDGHGLSLHPGYVNSGTVNNFTSYGNLGWGMQLMGNAGSSTTIRNAVVYDNANEVAADSTISLDADYNCIGSYADVDWTKQTNDVEGDPLVSDPASNDYTL